MMETVIYVINQLKSIKKGSLPKPDDFSFYNLCFMICIVAVVYIIVLEYQLLSIDF